jgi:hypothetical protein
MGITINRRVSIRTFIPPKPDVIKYQPISIFIIYSEGGICQVPYAEIFHGGDGMNLG